MSIQPWIRAPGTYHCWVDSGNIDGEAGPRFLLTTSVGNRTPNIFLSGPLPYQLGHDISRISIKYKSATLFHCFVAFSDVGELKLFLVFGFFVCLLLLFWGFFSFIVLALLNNLASHLLFVQRKGVIVEDMRIWSKRELIILALLSLVCKWNAGVLGHFFALWRLNWAGDSLG